MPDSAMHIVPLVVGEERDTVTLCQSALERGVFAQAIRPPSVPAGTARLRLTAMASHTPAELRRAARALAAAARGLGLEPTSIGAPAAQGGTGVEAEDEGLHELHRAHARAEEHAPAHAPFDVEQPPGSVALDPERAGAPRAPFDVEQPPGSVALDPERAGAPRAPFDVEREGLRAA